MGRAASTWTAGSSPAVGAAATGADSGPTVSASGTAAIAYQWVRPASTWVSAYGGWATASTVSPPVVERLEGPVGGVGAVDQVADRAVHRRPLGRHLPDPGPGGQPGRGGQRGRSGGELAPPGPVQVNPSGAAASGLIRALLVVGAHLMPVVAMPSTK